VVASAHAFGMVGCFGSVSKPHFHVEAVRHRRCSERARSRNAADASVNLLDLTKVTVPGQFAGMAEVAVRPLLATRLEDPVVLPNGLDHLFAFVDGTGKRFFAVHVLAR